MPVCLICFFSQAITALYLPEFDFVTTKQNNKLVTAIKFTYYKLTWNSHQCKFNFNTLQTNVINNNNVQECG